MLVSGVRSSCEASATNARWRASVASVSLRAALSSWSMSSNVWARSDDLVVGAGLGERDVGVAGAGDLARRAGEAGDRPHRALGHVQAGDEGEQRPAEHAEGEEEADAVDRGGGGVVRLGVLHEPHGRRQGLVGQRSVQLVALAAVRDRERARRHAIVAHVAESLAVGIGQRKSSGLGIAPGRSRRSGAPRRRRSPHRSAPASSTLMRPSAVNSGSSPLARSATVARRSSSNASWTRSSATAPITTANRQRIPKVSAAVTTAIFIRTGRRVLKPRPSARSRPRGSCAARAARRPARACGAGWR